MSVAIALFTIPVNGWLVVHEDANGKPGNVLGAHYVKAGADQSAIVKLLRGTAEGKVYYAMLHRDDGNPDDFSLARDLPVTDASGNPIMARFVATASTTAAQ